MVANSETDSVYLFKYVQQILFVAANRNDLLGKTWKLGQKSDSEPCFPQRVRLWTKKTFEKSNSHENLHSKGHASIQFSPWEWQVLFMVFLKIMILNYVFWKDQLLHEKFHNVSDCQFKTIRIVKFCNKNFGRQKFATSQILTVLGIFNVNFWPNSTT